MSIDVKNSPCVDQVGIEERIAKFCSRSVKKSSKVEALQFILSCIDLTTLEGMDTEGKVRSVCYKAFNLYNKSELPTVAAVCVYPSKVKIAKESLKRTNIKVASVATGFPSGQIDLRTKIRDTKFALANGADEIDMVISRGEFLKGNYNYVFDEIATIKGLCQRKKLKVILETGELSSLDDVRKASDIAISAGADFIKTSTGKISPASTMPVSLVMLEAIKDHFFKTGRKVGFKPAGGISTSKKAIQYLVMLYETLGNDWMTKDLFRFGASSLANNVLMQLEKQGTGYYQSSDYFSLT